jgi:hypothetical protein
LKEFLSHVDTFMEKDPWLKESENIDLIRDYFKSKFTILNMPGLFYFATEKFVNWSAVQPAAIAFLKNCYFNLCVEMTIFRQGKQGWDDIREYWDALGIIQSNIVPADFPAPGIKRSAKATRGKASKKQRNNLEGHARPGYQASEP